MPVISTNTSANTALYYLNKNSSAESSSIAKLSSGSRITKASDDAAGLTIGTSLKTDAAVLTQASTNASQASSILQTADGGLSQISDILTRMKVLAAQSVSGNVTDAQRSNDIQAEYTQLLSEIDTIAGSTKYNGQSLLDGTGQFATGVSFMVGTSSTDTITVTLAGSTSTDLALASTTVATQTDAQTALDTVTTALETLANSRATVGALESRFDYESNNISSQIDNTNASASNIMDVDVAAEKARLSAADVKTQASIAALTQAIQLPQQLLTLLKS